MISQMYIYRHFSSNIKIESFIFLPWKNTIKDKYPSNQPSTSETRTENIYDKLLSYSKRDDIKLYTNQMPTQIKATRKLDNLVLAAI